VSGRFALDRALLNRDFPASQWGSLGLWEAADDYAAACEALAVRLGEAAGLGAGDRLLDVGFGHGDQLLLWKARFAVGPVTGVEVDEAGLAEARRRLAAFPDVALGLDAPWPDAQHDAVLALDCAYHFERRPALFSRFLRTLRPGGVLALTDLALAAATRGPWVDRLARACDIPPENLMDAGDYARQLESLGFTQVRVERLDGVLDGFARFALRRWPARPGPGWGRIALSALAAGWLARTGAVRYVLVTARRPA